MTKKATSLGLSLVPLILLVILMIINVLILKTTQQAAEPTRINHCCLFNGFNWEGQLTDSL